MKYPTKKVYKILMAAALLSITSVDAAVQDSYPNKPIRLLTAAAPGGTSDILARLISPRLTEALKQPVIVDNRAGASGIIAAELVAKSAPDGYTLFIAYLQHTVNATLKPNLPYHVIESFTPITQLTSTGSILVIHPSTPVYNLKEFVEWTKNSKGTLNFGSSGLGSGSHLAGELYNVTVGIKSQHIPYKGGGLQLIDLVGGQYHYSFAGPAAHVHVRTGKLRMLAVTNPKRIASFPDLPAIAEIFPGFELVGWYGFIAPAKLPEPILMKLHDEVVKIIQSPSIRERIQLDGAEVVASSPKEFRKYLYTDMAKWAKLIKDSGAKFE